MGVIVEYAGSSDAEEAFEAAQQARTEAIKGPEELWSEDERIRYAQATAVDSVSGGLGSPVDQIYYPEATGQQVRRLGGEIQRLVSVRDPETVRELFEGGEQTGVTDPTEDPEEDLPPELRREDPGEGRREPIRGEEPEPNEIVLPFSELNKLQLISGVEDVTFEIPSVAQIQAAIADVVLDQRAIREALRDVLETTDIGGAIESPDTLFGPILGDAVDTIRGELAAVQDDIIETVEATTITTDDVIESIQEDLDLPGVDDIPDLEPIQEDINGILTALDEDVIGPLEELQTDLTEDLEGLQEDLELFTEIDSLEDLIDQIAERVSRLFVGEEAEERLRESLED